MENSNKDKPIDVKYLVRNFFRNWYLFLASLLIFIIIATVYLKISARTYLAGTKILINVEEQRPNSSGSSEYFNVADLMYQNKSLQNELAFLQSTPLIKEVVDDMNLITSYYMQEGRIPIPKELLFTLSDIYRQSPFIVVMDKSHYQPVNTMIYVGIRDDETYAIGAQNEQTVIYDFENEKTVRSGVNFELNQIAKFGETVENDYCSFKVLLNSNYNEEQFLGKELFFAFNSTASLANQFHNSLNIRTNERESAIVDMYFEWSNPQIAADFLNNLVDKYIQKNLEAKNRLANSTIEYIDQQLSNISGSLGSSEQQLQNFRSSYDVMSIDEKTRNLSSQIYSMENERDEIESNYRTLQQLSNYFEENKDKDNFVAPSMLGLEDEVLNTLIQEMGQLATEKQDLISRNQLKSPRLKTLTQNIQNIKRVISENLQLRIAAVESDLEDINGRIDNLNRDYNRLPQTQRRLTGLERQFNITNAAYTALMDKRIEAQIARASNRPDCEIIEPVSFMGVTSPNPAKIIALAIAFGLLIPFLYVFAKVYFTDKIKNLDEIDSLSNLKRAGYIPHSDSNKENVVLNEPHTVVTEAFHKAKSNIVYYLLGEQKKVILVTSAVPNEGKSFSSLNVATSFAVAQNKTLLLNFDMRKGNGYFKKLKLEEKPGISSYLINQASLEDIIYQPEIPNLEYIDSGEIPPDPVALISSPRTKELFKEIKNRYDYIIIDSPPYDVFADAFLLMSHADINLFVSRIGTVTRKAFKNSLNDFKNKNIENVYLMVNDLKNVNDSKYAYYKDQVSKPRRRFLFFRKK